MRGKKGEGKRHKPKYFEQYEVAQSFFFSQSENFYSNSNFWMWKERFISLDKTDSLETYKSFSSRCNLTNHSIAHIPNMSIWKATKC